MQIAVDLREAELANVTVPEVRGLIEVDQDVYDAVWHALSIRHKWMGHPNGTFAVLGSKDFGKLSCYVNAITRDGMVFVEARWAGSNGYLTSMAPHMGDVSFYYDGTMFVVEIARCS